MFPVVWYESAHGIDFVILWIDKFSIVCYNENTKRKYQLLKKKDSSINEYIRIYHFIIRN